MMMMPRGCAQQERTRGQGRALTGRAPRHLSPWPTTQSSRGRALLASWTRGALRRVRRGKRGKRGKAAASTTTSAPRLVEPRVSASGASTRRRPTQAQLHSSGSHGRVSQRLPLTTRGLSRTSLQACPRTRSASSSLPSPPAARRLLPSVAPSRPPQGSRRQIPCSLARRPCLPPPCGLTSALR